MLTSTANCVDTAGNAADEWWTASEQGHGDLGLRTGAASRPGAVQQITEAEVAWWGIRVLVTGLCRPLRVTQVFHFLYQGGCRSGGGRITQWTAWTRELFNSSSHLNLIAIKLCRSGDSTFTLKAEAQRSQDAYSDRVSYEGGNPVLRVRLALLCFLKSSAPICLYDWICLSHPSGSPSSSAMGALVLWKLQLEHFQYRNVMFQRHLYPSYTHTHTHTHTHIHTHDLFGGKSLLGFLNGTLNKLYGTFFYP